MLRRRAASLYPCIPVPPPVRPRPLRPHARRCPLTSSPQYRRGDSAPAVRQVRGALERLGRLDPVAVPDVAATFDTPLDRAVRAFQQERGLIVDGVVGHETWGALQAAGLSLGDRRLYYAVSRPFVGDDVADLQRRLTAMGFDVGREDGVFGGRTQKALQGFQREQGLRSDGICGEATLHELKRLVLTVRGGNAHELREAERLRRSGPSLAGRTLVLDAGHGGDDVGFTAHGLTERDVVRDIAARLEGRLVVAGVDVIPTHGLRSSASEAERAALANSSQADVVLSVHTDGSASPHPQGVATYYYGSGRDSPSVVGARLADLVQKEVVARTDLLDCRTHPKTWELLRLTRMPAVRVEVGCISHPQDAARLTQDGFRDTVAEAMLVAVQRLFLPVELDPPTGALRLPVGFGRPPVVATAR